MERKYNMEIEGLMVEITYDFTEGDKGDWMTPPTGDRVDILEWKLKNECREYYQDYDDEEWENWMLAIDMYVYNDAEWDILEFEKRLER